MRDAMLAVAGQLDLTMGGRPAELTKEPFSLRRAVYGYIDRQDLPGLYRVFDLASPDQSCPTALAYDSTATGSVHHELTFCDRACRANRCSTGSVVDTGNAAANRSDVPGGIGQIARG